MQTDYETYSYLFIALVSPQYVIKLLFENLDLFTVRPKKRGENPIEYYPLYSLIYIYITYSCRSHTQMSQAYNRRRLPWIDFQLTY